MLDGSIILEFEVLDGTHAISIEGEVASLDLMASNCKYPAINKYCITLNSAGVVRVRKSKS